MSTKKESGDAKEIGGADCNRLIEVLKSDKAKLKEELEKERKSYAELRELNADFQRRNAELQDKNAALRVENQGLRKKIAELQNNVIEAEDKSVEKKEQKEKVVKALQERIHELESQLASVRSPPDRKKRPSFSSSLSSSAASSSAADESKPGYKRDESDSGVSRITNASSARAAAYSNDAAGYSEYVAAASTSVAITPAHDVNASTSSAFDAPSLGFAAVSAAASAPEAAGSSASSVLPSQQQPSVRFKVDPSPDDDDEILLDSDVESDAVIIVPPPDDGAGQSRKPTSESRKSIVKTESRKSRARDLDATYRNMVMMGNRASAEEKQTIIDFMNGRWKRGRRESEDATKQGVASILVCEGNESLKVRPGESPKIVYVETYVNLNYDTGKLSVHKPFKHV